MTRGQSRRAIWYLAIAKRVVLWVQRMCASDEFIWGCASIREDIIELRQDIEAELRGTKEAPC